MKQNMKDALIIALMVLLLIISIAIMVFIAMGSIPVFAIIFPILFLMVVPWFLIVRYFRVKNPSYQEKIAQGKMSSDDINEASDKLLKHTFKFGCLPIIIAIIILIIFGIAVAITS